MDRKILVKLPRVMKKQLDQLRIRKNVNVSAFIRAAIERALKRAA